ncbi:stealth family protein [Streptomyces sp. NPDC002952]|uniref:stealth family protein n=1 Tax=Streptomyces sp. NPDC002952 TaxID=3364673 RepID=UPI003696B2BD
MEREMLAARSAEDVQSARRNPEASWWVSVYRRGLPVSARRVIAGRISPQVRRRAKARLAAVPSAQSITARMRAAWELRRFPDVFTGPSRVLHPVRGVPKAVLVTPGLSPLQARGDNLAAVCSALDGADIDYFCVRGSRDGAAVVGVAADDRPHVLTALAELCEGLPGYVSLMDGQRRVPRSSELGCLPAAWRAAARAEVIRMTWYYGDPQLHLVLGPEHGCDIEFWTAEDDRLVAPRANRITERILRHDTPVQASDMVFTRLASPVVGRTLAQVRTRREFTAPLPDDIRFPIDAVYTWVDGQDPAWLRRRAEATGEAYHSEAANAARYISRDELRYSLRSLHQNAPWIRTIYLVTDDQTPRWLDTSVPGLKVVSHKDIFTDPNVLPTFNSHAIESQIHHIDGLAEHFLYFNDDVFLGRPTTPQDFFHANGLTKFFPSQALIPLGQPHPDDVPVSVAGKNNRALLQPHFGTTITQKMKHTPHPLRRSILAEIEETFPQHHNVTASNRFRSLNDLSIASNLHHYYAYQSARAVPSTLRYAYLDLSHPNTPTRLDQLLTHRNRHAFCINDTISTEHDTDDQQELLHPFLECYFPIPSPHERTSRAAGGA